MTLQRLSGETLYEEIYYCGSLVDRIESRSRAWFGLRPAAWVNHSATDARRLPYYRSLDIPLQIYCNLGKKGRELNLLLGKKVGEHGIRFGG